MSIHAKTVPEFEFLVRALKSASVEASASEVHGLVCGLLCSGRVDASQRWHAELFDPVESGDSPTIACQQALERLSQGTKALLEDPDSGFYLMLPDDEQPLQHRAGALVEWCQGFLYGLGLSGVSERSFSGEIREALRDLAEITRMDMSNMEESEENEEAYMEISEFTRVAVMLVHGHMIAGLEQKS